MSDDVERLHREIAEIYANLETTKRESARQALQNELTQKQAELNTISKVFGEGNTIENSQITTGDITAGNVDKSQHGTVTMNDGTAHVLVGQNLGTIIYGRELAERDEAQLHRYFHHVLSEYGRLSLRGLAEADTIKHVSLQKIYISLATEKRVLLASGDQTLAEQYFEQERFVESRLKQAYDPDWALPDQAIVAVETHETQPEARSAPKQRSFFQRIRDVFSEPQPSETPDAWRAYRAELAHDAMNLHRHLMLLGDPGGGKSIFMQHIAAYLAHQAMQPNTATAVIPIVLRLRRLAHVFAKHDTAMHAIFHACHEQIRDISNESMSESLLNEAFLRGNVCLLADGLDEVPLDGNAPTA